MIIPSSMDIRPSFSFTPMQRAELPSSPWKSRIFVILFVVILALILAAFVWIVQSAKDTLPQSNEVISLEQAAERIQQGQVERILVQDEQDVFLYLPDESRPLYTRLALGQTFTGTFEGLGIPAVQFPPLTVESD